MSALIDSQEPQSKPHPPGLSTLFFTELWERFSFYGMRALLVLFMVDSVDKGGLGLNDKFATSIYGLYTASVYLTALPGGWIADRLLGARRSVWYGGLLIAAGHFTLAIPRSDTFYLGLVLIVIGTGLLKPNISVMVGRLYPEGGGRRDAGFTIFYMGINIGAAIGPMVCSYLGEHLNWHYGFAAAGFGMLAALAYFRLTEHRLGPQETAPPAASVRTTSSSAPSGWMLDPAWLWPIGGLLALLLVVGLVWWRFIELDPIRLAKWAGYLILAIGVLFWLRIVLFGKLESDEFRRVSLLALLVMAAALFWAGFEQAGSSLNLFAERHTHREVWGRIIPAGWFQSLNPVFIIVLSPVVASIWIQLTRQKRDLSIPAKFALGLILLGLGFVVMSIGSRGPSVGQKALPTWLIGTYLCHTVGELCLSPVGLSAVSKLAPSRFVGQFMGLWFLASSLGNLVAGVFAGGAMEEARNMPTTFLQFAWIPIICGFILFVISRRIAKSEASHTC